jgi:hypothetical protein
LPSASHGMQVCCLVGVRSFFVRCQPHHHARSSLMFLSRRPVSGSYVVPTLSSAHTRSAYTVRTRPLLTALFHICKSSSMSSTRSIDRTEL